MSVCLSVCPPGFFLNHTRDLYQFLCVFLMSVARSSSCTFTIGRIAYRREGVFPLKIHYRPGKMDGSAQRGRSMLSTIVLFCYCQLLRLCRLLPCDALYVLVRGCPTVCLSHSSTVKMVDLVTENETVLPSRSPATVVFSRTLLDEILTQYPLGGVKYDWA